MYRPQFPFGPEPGVDDGDFDHYFDYLTVPLLNNTALAASGIIQNINLQLQQDWPFDIYGIQVKAANAGDPVVEVLFKDCFGNSLSDDYVPLDLAYAPDGQGLYFTNIVFEPKIPCPPGGVILMNLKNQTSGSADLTKVRIVISGMKRRPYKAVQCA